MKNYLTIYLAASAILISSIDATASTCNNPPIEKSPHDFREAASLILEEPITACDLQSKYDSSLFPRFYLDLDKGLTQERNKSDIRELALNLAKDSAEKNELDRAELIYRIILAHDPAESRAMSSYAVVHIFRKEYSEALQLLTQAISISPQDPIILNNLYTLNVWLGKYEAANNLNKQLLKIEPNVPEHLTRRALLDVLFVNDRSSENWASFLETQSDKNKGYWEYFLGALAKADKARNFEELTDMGNQWIDIGMPSEALMLFDHILSLEKVPTAHFLKAKAFERGKHYRLAFQSTQSALEIARSADGSSKELYGNILYETARLAYAVNEYEHSLALLDEYKTKGYSHPHLDYMFAVNLDASGKYAEASPYLQKCSIQQLPDFMKNFCNKKKLAHQAKATTPETKLPPGKTIRISDRKDSPSSVMKYSWPSLPVGWLGEIIDADITETNSTLHVRLTAQHLQPINPLEIEDDKDYEISIEQKNHADIFAVNLDFGALTEKQISELKKSITREKFLVAQGRATHLEMFKKQLVPGIVLERAIFTSKITPHEFR